MSLLTSRRGYGVVFHLRCDASNPTWIKHHLLSRQTRSCASSGTCCVMRRPSASHAHHHPLLSRDERTWTLGVDFFVCLKNMNMCDVAMAVVVRRCLNWVTPFHCRYTGVMETTRIRRQGYAIRTTFEDFVARYESGLLKAWSVSGTH